MQSCTRHGHMYKLLMTNNCLSIYIYIDIPLYVIFAHVINLFMLACLLLLVHGIIYQSLVSLLDLSSGRSSMLGYHGTFIHRGVVF